MLLQRSWTPPKRECESVASTDSAFETSPQTSASRVPAFTTIFQLRKSWLPVWIQLQLGHKRFGAHYIQRTICVLALQWVPPHKIYRQRSQLRYNVSSACALRKWRKRVYPETAQLVSWPSLVA